MKPHLLSPPYYIVGITIMLSDFVMVIVFAQVHIPQCSEGGSTRAGASYHSQAAVPSEGDLRLQTWRIHLVAQGQSISLVATHCGMDLYTNFAMCNSDFGANALR